MRSQVHLIGHSFVRHLQRFTRVKRNNIRNHLNLDKDKYKLRWKTQDSDGKNLSYINRVGAVICEYENHITPLPRYVVLEIGSNDLQNYLNASFGLLDMDRVMGEQLALRVLVLASRLVRAGV